MAVDGNPEVNLEMGKHPNGGEEGEKVEVQGVGERQMGYLEREIYLQVELHADEENDSTDTKRKKRVARAALTVWKEKIKTLEQRKLQWESETRSMMNEVYNLVSLYSVFVGVVLTAVATSSRLECQHLWSPVGLSLFAYSMLVVVAFTKFREILRLEWMKELTIRILAKIEGLVSTLRRVGYADFDFESVDQDVHPHLRHVNFWRNALGLIVPLTIFTAGLVFSLVHIMCWS